MTNIYEINDLVDFLEKHQINIKQFMYCLLLHYDKKHSRIEGTHKISKPLSKLYKYYTNVEKWTSDDLKHLESKGFITTDGSYKPDMVEVTDKFEKKWYGSKYKFEQLKELYPQRIRINNDMVPLVTFSSADGYEKISALYNRFAKTYKMHNRILSIVQWAKDNDKLNVGIEKFVSSKYWETLQVIRDKELKSNMANL